MQKEPKGLSEPIRYGCRVCQAKTIGTSTVCERCEPMVQEYAGGIEDRHVRAYIAYINQKATLSIDDLPTDLRTRYVQQNPVVPGHGRHRCSCGQLYGREISVTACEARDHRILNANTKGEADVQEPADAQEP